MKQCAKIIKNKGELRWGKSECHLQLWFINQFTLFSLQ